MQVRESIDLMAVEACCHEAWPFIVEAIVRRHKRWRLAGLQWRRSFSARQCFDS
jgi:hypothetical protein